MKLRSAAFIGLGILLTLAAGQFLRSEAVAEDSNSAEAANLTLAVPPELFRPADISVLDWGLVRAGPMIQSLTKHSGAEFASIKIDYEKGCIRVHFIASRMMWDRDGVVGSVGMILKSMFPDIPQRVWLLNVLNTFDNQTYIYDDGKWTARPFGKQAEPE